MHSVALDTSRVVWLQLLGYRQLRRPKVAYLIEREANVRAVGLCTVYFTVGLVGSNDDQSPVFRNGGGSGGHRFVQAPRNLHQLAPTAGVDHVAVIIHTSCLGRALEAHAVFAGDAADKPCQCRCAGGMSTSMSRCCMSRPVFVRAGRIPNWHLQADGSALSKMLLVLEKAGHFVQDVLLPPVLLYVSASHGKHAYVDGVNIARLRPGSHTPASWSSSITIRVSCSSEPRMSLCVT